MTFDCVCGQRNSYFVCIILDVCVCVWCVCKIYTVRTVRCVLCSNLLMNNVGSSDDFGQGDERR